MTQSDKKGEERGLGSVWRFFRFIFRAIRNYFIFIGVLVTALPIVTAYLYSRRQVEPTTTIELSADKPVDLKFELSGKMTEQEPSFIDQIFGSFWGNTLPLYLPDLRSALRHAGKDDRIKGLNVTMGSVEAGSAEFTELRRIFADFKATGKSLTVQLNEAQDWSYYAATGASRIVLNPTASVVIPGPVFQLIYFGDALKRLGVNFTVTKAGRFKTAMEPLIANEPSEATREQYSSMESSLRSHVIEAVAESRKRDQATVRGWFEKSIFTAQEAVKNGLVDDIGYISAENLSDKKNKDDVTLSDYFKSIERSDGIAQDKGGIAYIEAVGEIHMREDQGASSNLITPHKMRKQIRWARDDDEVKAVVLRISSPGGSATASDIIWHDLAQLAEVKPLVVSMGDYAASGGYYIAVPARKVIAEPTTITGSIGVFGMMPNLSKFGERWGVTFFTFTESAREALFNLGKTPTDEDRQLLAAATDQVYHLFLERVAAGRRMKPEEVDRLGQGRVYTGLEAQKLGLVDEIGGVQSAFKSAKEFAGLDSEKLYPVLRYKEDQLSLKECLSSPSRFMRCIDTSGGLRSDVDLPLGTSLAERLFKAGLPLAGDHALATKFRQWLESFDKGEPLVLWTDYLGLSVK